MRTTETQENLALAEQIGMSGWEFFLKQSAHWELQLAGEQNTEEALCVGEEEEACAWENIKRAVHRITMT